MASSPELFKENDSDISEMGCEQTSECTFLPLDLQGEGNHEAVYWVVNM